MDGEEGAMGIEREMKLPAWAGFALPDMTGAIDGLTEVQLPTAQLTATYFDTPDLRLTRSGVSLRHRVGTGESGWTVKLPEGSDGPALVRREVNFEGPPSSSVVPEGAASLVRAYLRNDTLVPVGKLVTKRRRVELRDADQRAVAEIDDDEVSVLEGRRVAERFRQIEGELTRDAPKELLGAVAERLRVAGAGEPDPVPKIVRALGARATEPPDMADLIGAVSPEASFAELVQATVAAGVYRLIRHDPGVRLGDDPEDVHQARVATRRLRSDLRTFRRLLDEEWVAALRNELKWIAAELGEVRDADVLSERLRKQAAELPAADAKGAAALLRKLATERLAARDRLAVAFDSPRYVDLVDDLVRAAAEPRLLEEAAELTAAEAAPELVRRPWQHLNAAVDAVGKESEDELLHEVRKRAKQARYASEAVVGVVGKPASQLAGAVADVQEVLGGLQDGVVAEEWLRKAAAGGGSGGVER